MNLWTAAADNDIAYIRESIDRGGSHPNEKDESGYTPIHAAASYGHIDLLKFLVEKGGDVNIQDSDGDTPLHACESPIAARTLISLGADPNVKNSEGQTPLDKAVEEQEYPELINYFMTLMGKSNPNTNDNIEFKVNFQEEHQSPVPGERSLNAEQREQLSQIINSGTDADLEQFLQKAMNDANAQAQDEATNSPSGKKSRKN